MSDVELDLIGAAIADPRITASVKVQEQDFLHPSRGMAWVILGEMHEEGTAPDPLLIANRASARGIRIDPQLIVDAVGAGLPANAGHYADMIRDAAHRRRLSDALTRARQQLDSDADLPRIVSDLSKCLDVSEETENVIETAVTLDELADTPIPADDWVIPGLMARGDRAIITGAEGWGKTTLIRQLAVCAAAGLHPFAFADASPQRVLMVDAENPLGIMVRRMGALRNEMARRGKPTKDRFWVSRQPQGMDLSRPGDRLKLHALCRMFRPDLLVIGPAYKLYVGGAQSREEDLARQVTSTLDGLREEFGLALILEHHSPHGMPGQKRTVRPIGSTLWQRWPEFGFGLAASDRSTRDHRVAVVQHWRGMREDRPWPRELEQGQSLPWVDADPADTLARSA